MGITTPLQEILSITNTSTSAGNTEYPFRIPNNVDTLIVKCWGNNSGTFSGTSNTAAFYLLTTDYSTNPAGVQNWYTISNFAGLTGTNAGDAGYPSETNARFFIIPVAAAGGVRGTSSGSVNVASMIATGGQQSGLPILSRDAKIVLQYTGTIGNNSGVNLRIYAPHQSRYGLNQRPICFLDINDTSTTLGPVYYTAYVPQDAPTIVAKAWHGVDGTNGLTGTSPLVQVFVQTTDNGTTWYDCANLGAFSDTDTSFIERARIQAISVASAGSTRLSINSNMPYSVVGGSTAGATTTGLPILSRLVRVMLLYQGTEITANSGIRVQLFSTCSESNNSSSS